MHIFGFNMGPEHFKLSLWCDDNLQRIKLQEYTSLLKYHWTLTAGFNDIPKLLLGKENASLLPPIYQVPQIEIVVLPIWLETVWSTFSITHTHVHPLTIIQLYHAIILVLSHQIQKVQYFYRLSSKCFDFHDVTHRKFLMTCVNFNTPDVHFLNSHVVIQLVLIDPQILSTEESSHMQNCLKSLQ